MKKIIAIVPIRDDSSRLPNKATGFELYNNLTPVECIINRLLLSKKINDILFLVPNTDGNKYLIDKIKTINISKINIYAGFLNDISGRALSGIREVYYLNPPILISINDNNLINSINGRKKDSFLGDPPILINITGDCPLVDPFLIDYLVEKFLDIKLKNPDQLLYLSNTITRSYPDGFDIQIYDYKLLELSRIISLDKKKTTNLGWDIVNYSGYMSDMGIDFKLLNYPASEEIWHPEWGFVLDYKEDIEVIKSIYNHFNRFDFTCEEVIRFINDNLQILTNKNCKRTIPGE